MSNFPKQGQVWRHSDNRDLYTVVEILPIKLDGEWDSAGLVVYQKTNMTWKGARLMGDFMQHFKLEGGE